MRTNVDQRRYNAMEKKILVVDDDSDIRQMLSTIVSIMGHEPEMACDGLEAIGHIKGQVPDLILLDLMMPRMNGFQVLNFMTATPATRRVPVIVITAASDETIAALPGVYKVIKKTEMKLAILREIINAALDKDPRMHRQGHDGQPVLGDPPATAWGDLVM
jgi:CheY-like chemotaxis protein